MEGSRVSQATDESQPRTRCLACDRALRKTQIREGNTFCGHECLGRHEGWRSVPKHAECLYCDKPLTYEQRKNRARYCCPGHALSAKRWPKITDWWAHQSKELEKDRWEKRAPKMQRPESQKDWHISQIMREEIRRGRK